LNKQIREQHDVAVGFLLALLSRSQNEIVITKDEIEASWKDEFSYRVENDRIRLIRTPKVK
jgi:hypothetical protein